MNNRSSDPIFSPLVIGRIGLPHRLVMAPLTRARAFGGVPDELTATYYAQRASAGLIIAEGTQPSAVGQGYANTPGLHTPEQAAGWASVARAVHDQNGHIFVQLMHAGRVAHPDNKGGLESVAPSRRRANGTIHTPNGPAPLTMPRELSPDEVRAVVTQYVDAAVNAVEAGLDGVEIHGANGYLLHQFLAKSANTRGDSFGGSPQRRAQFAIDVCTRVSEAIGPDRVGLRISPTVEVNGITEPDDDDTWSTYRALVDGITGPGLAYLSILGDPTNPSFQSIRERFGGIVIANTGYARVTSHAEARSILEAGYADAVAVGRAFLANPDLPHRWKLGLELNDHDPSTYYGGGERGYIDYPTSNRESP